MKILEFMVRVLCGLFAAISAILHFVASIFGAMSDMIDGDH